MQPQRARPSGFTADGAYTECEIHPVYGALPVDGEIVRVGDLLGLSTDSTEAVVAPTTGRVRLVLSADEAERRLCIQIWPVETDSAAYHERLH